MQCLQCGSEQATGNAFCTKCGARLAGSTVPDRRPSEADEKMPISTSAREEEETILRELKEALKGVDSDKGNGEPQKDRPAASSSKKFVVAGVVAVLILAAVIGFEVARRKEHVPEPQPAPIEAVLQPPPSLPVPSEATRSTVGKIAAILEAIEQYQKTRKALPPALTTLSRTYANPAETQDGWGQNILYLVDLTNKTFVIRSAGPDGKRDTSDDISVASDGSVAWLKENEPLITEWRAANAEAYARLLTAGSSPPDPKKLEAARKVEEERKRQEAEATAAARKQELEQKRLESARLEEERRKQAEARREEELRQAKVREEALRQQQTTRRAETVRESFIGPLDQWDAPGTWEIVKDKDVSALRVQGLGFLKKGQQWDNYKVEFEIRVNKESAGWVLRAQNSGNFYLFKLGSEKAKAIPKNSLVKYIRLDGQYLNSLKREDAPGAAGVTPLSMKVRNKDYYKVMVTVRGNTITHYIDGVQVDAWNDDTFNHGRFGFNASAIEQATIRNLVVEPLR
jgi:flagellar motor protein MotB